MTHLIFPLLGLWRSWLGGGIGKDWPFKSGLTWLQYALALLLVYAATWHDPWQVTAIDGVGVILLARIYGHGPMLQFPLGTKDGDFILSIVGGAGGGVLRYFAYAAIRYVLPAVIWSAGLWYVHAPYTGPVIGSMAVVVAYFAFTCAVHKGVKLPTFATPGDEAANWSELVGWTALGAALVALS
jgi:hypothetical protein